jgi:uncharacterized protein
MTSDPAQQKRNHLLQRAVREGDSAQVARALKLGASPEGVYPFPVLHRAIDGGNEPIVRLLVEAGADIERTSRDGWTPLTRADANEQFSIVDYLVSVGADELTRHRHGFTPLHQATRAGDDERCSFLLRREADVEAKAADGSTALLLASGLCDGKAAAAVSRTLLHHRADPNVVDDDGRSAIATAAYEDAAHAGMDGSEIVRVPLLLSAGADPNLGSYHPLLASISHEGHDWRVIDLLLRNGADPDAVDDCGTGILHRAAQITSDAEFIVQCGMAVSNIDSLDSSGAGAVEYVFDEWWNAADQNDASELLAFVALGADLSSVADRLPDWLDRSGSAVRVHGMFEPIFLRLQQMVAPT